MRTRILAGLVLLLGLFAASANAQVNPGTESGVPAYGRFEGSDFDQINLLNGNLHLNIPVLTVKERGRTFTWNLTYEPVVWNLVWFPVPKAPPPAKDLSYYAVSSGSYPGLVLRSPFAWGGGGGTLSAVLTCVQTNQQYQVYTNFATGSPDSTVHSLPLREEMGQHSCFGSTLGGPTTDGSGAYYSITTGVATQSDGTRKIGTTIEDANGNLATASM